VVSELGTHQHDVSGYIVELGELFGDLFRWDLKI
jgi:hypothetical protein